MSSPHTIVLDDIPKLQPFFIGSMSLPPGINRSYKIGRIRKKDAGGVRTFSTIIASPELEQFKHDAHYELVRATQDYATINAIRESRLFVPLGVVMHFHLPSTTGKKKLKDIDGVIKAAQDAAFARMELNDVLVDDLHIIRHRDSLNPRIDIEVRCLLMNRG